MPQKNENENGNNGNDSNTYQEQKYIDNTLWLRYIL